MRHPETDPEGEKAIIERVLAGETDAFTVLVDRYQGPLISFLFHMVRDMDAARDLAQETFVKAFLSMRGFETRNQAAFSTWLFAIARNGCVDALRKRKRKFEELEEGQPELRLEAGQTAHLEAGRFRDGLESALVRLSPKHRMAFELTLVQGFTYEETAAILKTNSGTIRSRVSRVRAFLQENLRHLSREE